MYRPSKPKKVAHINTRIKQFLIGLPNQTTTTEPLMSCSFLKRLHTHINESGTQNIPSKIHVLSGYNIHKKMKIHENK